MNLFKFISVCCPDINPEKTKIHLAVWNGYQNPFDVFIAGNFEKWQSWQSKQNFNREFIVSLIQLSEPNTWLFAGAFKSLNCDWNENHYDYDTSPVEELEQYTGRLKIHFNRTGRQSYLKAENWCELLNVNELLAERIIIRDFTGYSTTMLSKAHLDIVVKQKVSSWYNSLSSVSGIYLITDLNSGKMYVGSATGEGGIWQRWVDYSLTGHGGNVELRNTLKSLGHEYVNNFQYSVLEIADTHTTTDEIRERENYWKEVLGTRKFGYNAN
ncbi:GIY-YIG nuclease family protein [Kiloniella laminariae]|uniref:GIY-YIG nuclease family protein n=1 Tax=Kiloniella laminariae TaxID=454162 RepID=A0ABT4LFQ9_9PROT|nr:GIY-YIG nuclease family protein [Kiloniella laminariae]MCZ4279933.1 GIY-YIG nuclease family protein [Kiloniella laminariae]